VKVTFLKKGARHYAVLVRRDRYPDLWCSSIGYDDFLPHDLLHFVAEAEYGLDGGVFGDLAAGGNARIFQPVDPALVPKMWRKQRIARLRLPDGRRSSSPGSSSRAGGSGHSDRSSSGSSTISPSSGTHCRREDRPRSNGRGRKSESATRRASADVPQPRDSVSVRACPPARAAPA
jgi:hypothetical protein